MLYGRLSLSWSAFGLLVAVLLAMLLPIASADAQVRVRGYFRRDGTYVQPHMRSAPDGNPYNNWSFPGNVNPYTGETAKADPETYLRNYYQRNGGSSTGTTSNSDVSLKVVPALPRVEREGRPSLSRPGTLPVTRSALPNFVAQEDLQRSQHYCHRVYAAGSPYREDCEIEQYRTLARVVLPDYTTLPKQDVGRSAGYCERIYNDNRAAFYDWVNDQILGLHQGSATFAGVAPAEAARAEGYCERIYGDNRAAAADCARDQARRLVVLAPDGAELPAMEWNASNRYCERIYGDNRAAVLDCKRDQAQGLRGPAPQVEDLPTDEWSAASQYCERIYRDNRSAGLDCKRDQASGIRRHLNVSVSDTVPAVEWQQSVRYCERIYSDNRASALECRSDQARSLEIVARTDGFNRSIDAQRRMYCERIYSSNRASFWDCVYQR